MNENFNPAVESRKKPSFALLGAIMSVSALLASLGIAIADKAGTAALTVVIYAVSAVLIALAAGIFATFIVTRANAVYFIFCPIAFAVGAVVISLLGGGLDKQILLISFIVTGAVAAISVNQKGSRTGTAAGIAAGAALCLIGALIYSYVSKGNEFSVNAIKDFLSAEEKAVEEQAKNFVTEYFLPYFRTLGEYSAVKSPIDENVFTEFATNLVYTVSVLLPGITLMLLQIFGFITTCFFKHTVERLGYDVVLPSPRWELYPTSVTAWIYIAAYGIYAFSSLIASIAGAGGLIMIIALNVILTVFPVMFWLGGAALFGKRRKVRFRIGGGFILLILIGVLFIPAMVVSVISFIGAWMVIGQRRAEAAEEKKNDDENDFRDL